MNLKYLTVSIATLIGGSLFPTTKQTPQPSVAHQGDPLSSQYPAAYNAPAAFDLSCKADWLASVHLDATFLYWYGTEEGLGIASNSVVNGGTSYLTPNTQTLNMNYNYKPGFQVGLGMVIEKEWNLNAQYTWLRGTNTVNSNPPSTFLTAGVPITTAQTGTSVWSVDNWFFQGTRSGQALMASNIQAKWKYGLDIIDLMTGRPYYQGRYVTISPSVGLRAAWIRQMMKISLTEATVMFDNSNGIAGVAMPPQPITSKTFSQSWGIGPKIGCNGLFLLPIGFRFEGDIAMSLLYTRYKMTHREDRASVTYNSGPYVGNISNLGYLRPSLEMGLGTGWGSYVYGNSCHVDFLLSYNFSLYWNQNMMRRHLDYVISRSNPAATNLEFNGLSFKAAFDF